MIIQKQIEAAKKAGYTVWADDQITKGACYRFTTPGGDYDSPPYGEPVAAWSYAYDHLKQAQAKP